MYCDAAKHLCDSKNIKYIVDSYENLVLSEMKPHGVKFPQIYIVDDFDIINTHIGGYTELEQYLKPNTINKFVQRTFPKSSNPRGLGFDKPSLEDEQNRYPSNFVSNETFGHTGFTGTMTWVDPINNFFVILLTNRVYPNRNQKGLYTLNIRPQLLDYVVKY